MSTLYITRPDAHLHKVNERLQVRAGNAVILDVPLIKISEVAVIGRTTISGATIAMLLKHQIPVCYVSSHGEYLGQLLPECTAHVALRREQYAQSADETRALRIAREIVIGKLTNLKTLLRRRGRQKKTSEFDAAAERLNAAIRKAQTAETLDKARGCEGDGSAAYFGVFANLLTAPKITFEKRIRRPPTDPVNALLSFGYTLLNADLIAAAHFVGFDPYVGFLHADRYGRASLALDLMEEFRPIIVDMLVLNCLNKKIITSADFEQKKGKPCHLTDEARKTFLAQYEERKTTEVTHPILREKMTYLRCFEEQARLLAKTLAGEADRYQPFLLP